MPTIKKRIDLVLPMPPSVNVAYAGYPKRHKSDAYKAWEKEAQHSLNDQEKFEITGDKWLGVIYEFHFPIFNRNGTKKKRDIFNYEKCLSDFLGKRKDGTWGIKGFEDHKIATGRVEKVDSKEERVIIRIWEL